MICVLDASVAVEIVAGGARAQAAGQAIAPYELLAPAIIDLEVASALARLERSGRLASDRAAAGLRALGNLPARRVPLSGLLDGAWSLRQPIRIADAFYLALARELGCALVTADARLARAPHPGVAVTLVG